MLNRRSFAFGLLAAPAIIRTPGLLMPVRRVLLPPAVVPPLGLSVGLFQNGQLVAEAPLNGSAGFPSSVAFSVPTLMAGAARFKVLMDGKPLYPLETSRQIPHMVRGDTLVLTGIEIPPV